MASKLIFWGILSLKGKDRAAETTLLSFKSADSP
jgi:hypothetical protein